MNKSYRGRSCPIAVHCSDGVGRAGTYILIDMVLNRMSKVNPKVTLVLLCKSDHKEVKAAEQKRDGFSFDCGLSKWIYHLCAINVDINVKRSGFNIWVMSHEKS